MPTSISQKFATALVASKLRSHTYVTEPIEQVTQLLRDNHAPTLYLGQFDQYNNLGNLRGNRVDRLTTWLSTESMIKRK